MVPANRGIAPNVPSLATWSDLIAVCGLQLKLKRNSVRGTLPKNRMVSNKSERTIPTVVIIAISEQTRRKILKTRSTEMRARNFGEIRLRANIRQPRHKAMTTANSAKDPMCHQSFRRLAASITEGSPRRLEILPSAMFLTSFNRRPSLSSGKDLYCSDRLLTRS